MVSKHGGEKQKKKGKRNNTYSSWDSPVVTDLSTNQPVNCLNLAERTGCLAFSCLWPYMESMDPV